MREGTNGDGTGDGYTGAAVAALPVLTGTMLLARATRTEPHPPPEVEPLALLFAPTGPVSYGPRNFLDPACPGIWPAAVAAQAAIGVILWRAVRSIRPAGGSGK